MTALSIAAGVLVVVITVTDVVSTVVAVSGRAGPITGRVSLFAWRLLLRIHDRRTIHRGLRIGGVAITLGTVLTWLVLLWVGWTLVFVDGTVVDATTKAPVDAWDRAYYVGYTLFTMGNGDLVGATEAWRLVTVLANALGLALVTLAVTYLVPIVQAVVDKRSTATALGNLGMTSERILRDAWNGEDLGPLAEQLEQLAVPIDKLAQQHLAYPNLHYQHATDSRSALAPRLVAIDDVLTVLTSDAVRPGVVDPRRLQPARRAIGNLLDSLEPVLATPGQDAPRTPDLSTCELPTASGRTLEDAFRSVEARRRQLAAFLHHDGWDWDAVLEPDRDPGRDESVDDG